MVSGYALTFGGFLLLGGRMGDLLGRRKLFMVGLALFAISSLLCGLSVSSGMLIAAPRCRVPRARSSSPSVFSIVSVTFAEGLGAEQGARASSARSPARAPPSACCSGGILTEYVGLGVDLLRQRPDRARSAVRSFRATCARAKAEGMARHFDAAGAPSPSPPA